MSIGIYKLSFSNTDKVYIGQSINIESRITNHKNSLKQGTSAVKLQNAYNTYGMPTVEILKECNSSDLDDQEEYYINIYDSVNNGFNTCDRASQPPIMRGESHGMSRYTDAEIYTAFNLLVHKPHMTIKEVSEATNVSIPVVKKISSGESHSWLEDKYPEEYSILKSNASLRATNHTALKGEAHGMSSVDNILIQKVFNLLVHNPELTGIKISEITGVSLNIIQGISRGTTHLWLKDSFQEEYSTLVSNKDIRKNKSTSKGLGITYPPLISPEGVVYTDIPNVSEFARAHKLHQGHLCTVLNGKAKQHKGWKLFKE